MNICPTYMYLASLDIWQSLSLALTAFQESDPEEVKKGFEYDVIKLLSRVPKGKGWNQM